jgi:hypothetical protein
VSDPFKFAVDILPKYAVTDTLTAYLNGGLKFTGETKTKQTPNDTTNGTTKVEWYVNPYVEVAAAGGAFYAGVRLEGASYENKAAADGHNPLGKWKASGFKWSIPVGVAYSF